MIDENQEIEMTWAGRNFNYYIEKGYKYTKRFDKFKVKLKDLPPSSQKRIIAFCDICGKKLNITYVGYLKNTEKDGKLYCKKCSQIKRENTFLERYGTTTPMGIEGVQEKIKSTNRKKYGVDFPAQNRDIQKKIEKTNLEKYGKPCVLQVPEIKERIEQTNLEKYGVSNVFASSEIKEKIVQNNLNKYGKPYTMQIPEVKEKAQKTMIEKYGKPNAMQVSEIRERALLTNLKKYGRKSAFESLETRNKAVQTVLKKYGKPYILQVPEIRQKAIESMAENGNVRSSKPEKKLCELVKETYPNCKVTFGFVLERAVFDCLLEIQGEKIDIEYDGEYWHNLEANKKRDIRRDYFVRSKGYKILRVKGNFEIPTKQQLVEAIDSLLQGKNHTKIVLDIKNKQ